MERFGPGSRPSSLHCRLGGWANATSEKLAPSIAKFSRSFRELFLVFEFCRTRSDAFGHVRMRSDAIGCISVRWDAFGHFRKFSYFSEFFRTIFGRFWSLGAYYWEVGGLLLWGANYWEVALYVFGAQRKTWSTAIGIEHTCLWFRGVPKMVLR